MIPEDDDLELDELDLDSALDAWEADFEGTARAESAPMPQSSAGDVPAPEPPPPAAPKAPPAPKPQPKAPAAGGRPLYRPDPELERRSAGAAPPPEPAAVPVDLPSFDDDEEEEATRIAAIPKELIASLQSLEEERAAKAAAKAAPEPAGDTPTKPPPAADVELDLDDLLDGLENAETRMSDLPAPPPEASRPDSRPASKLDADPDPESEAAAREIESIEQDLLDPFSDEVELDAPAAKKPFVPPPPAAFGPIGDDGEDDEPELQIAAPDDEEPQLQIAAPDDDAPELQIAAPDDDEPDLQIAAPDDEPDLQIAEPDDDAPDLQVAAPDDDAPELQIAAPDDDEPELQIAEPDDDAPELQIAEPDDDEPDLQIAAPDDDEPELQIAAPDGDDDDEPDLEVAEPDDLDTQQTTELEAFEERDSGLSELAPPPTTAERRAAPARRASAAGRTVRHRKPRRERYAFVGHDADTARRRSALLRTLAERQSGSARARLLVAAAELLERLGAHEEARQAYADAHEADPSDLAALRALRRDAVGRSDWSEVARLLEAEAALPLSSEDKGLALSLLAEVQLTQLSDPEAAERSARSALAAHASVSAGLVLVEACRLQDKSLEGGLALQKSAEIWQDPEGAALLLETLGRRTERAGNRDRAAAHYAAALERDPKSLGAVLGQARCVADRGERSRALEQAAGALTGPVAREALLRLAAREALFAGDPARALTLTEGATRPPTLRLRAHAAKRADAPDVREAALTALAAATGGTERALALVDLADLHAERGDVDATEAALTDASLADERLDTVRVVREVAARRLGQPRLARPADVGGEGGGALETAAKLARGDDRAAEAEWLERARQEGHAPVAADLLLLDVAAEEGRGDVVAEALRRQADRALPERKLGPLLTLAERRADEREALWREALKDGPQLPALRALARHLSASAPAEAAELWLSEADGASGGRAFHALVQAGRALRAAGDADGARAAFDRAFDELPGPSPAVWMLEAQLVAAGDGDALTALHERRLDVAETAREAAEAAVRVAFVRGGDGALLEQAHEHLERAGLRDPVLESLLASAPGTDAGTRAAMFEAQASDAEPGPRRVAALRAGLAHELAGTPRAAAALYRGLLEAHPDPLLEAGRERAELAAGEHARVGERRFAAVKAAEEGEGSKLAAMEALVDLDLHVRDDASSAALTLQSILQEVPGHLPTLRALERYYLGAERDDDLLPVEHALLAHLEGGDAIAAARLAIRLLLARQEVPGDAADPLLRELTARFGEDWPEGAGWVARRVEPAAEDDVTRARARLAIARGFEGSTEELGAALLHAADVVEELEGPGEAASLLAPAVQALPEHPLLAEAQGRLLARDGEPEEAASAFETAAAASRVEPHRVELLYAAARAWEDAGATEQALARYEEAARLDVTYADLFERAKALLEKAGQLERLAALTHLRLDAGTDPRTELELHETQARLAESMGDRTAARKALEAALELDPKRVEALRRLAQLCLDDEDWRAAAEALIRIARLRQDREELRWVFFTLGDIYDQRMPDPRRAEAAFRRVLKLVPDDLEAMDRLASLYEREGAFDKAVVVLRELAEKELDPDETQRHLLRVAQAFEKHGDPRSAERVLDDARKQDPTDLVFLRAMAELYQRQGAHSALSMHLGRALGDFRRAIEEAPAQVHLWSGLVEVLDWKDRKDAARVAASAAFGLGVQDVELAKRVDERGGVPGAGAAAASPELRDLLAPRALSLPLFEVFRLASDAFDKALPFDARSWRAEKLPGRNHPLKAEAQRVGQWFGMSDVQILVTGAAPRLCVPVAESPVTLLVGRDLASLTDEAERAFLFARALAVASAHLTVALRTQPAQLALTLAGLIRSYDPHYAPKGVDAGELDEVAKRVGKAIPRRAREPLGPVTIEMGGAPGFDPVRLGVAAAELGDRVALLALGTTPAALSGLLKLAGAEVPEGAPVTRRVKTLRKVGEAWNLLRFAISDAHFDARRRAGAERL